MFRWSDDPRHNKEKMSNVQSWYSCIESDIVSSIDRNQGCGF
jgi:hypothetical protein